MGGASEEQAYDNIIDPSGNKVLVGFTKSSTFPVYNAFQNILRGGHDAFMAKFSPTNQLEWSTYFGGTKEEYALASVMDNSGNIYTAGVTWSTDLPIVNAFQSASGGDVDGFIVKQSSSGSIQWASYIGGSSYDAIYDIAIRDNGNIVLCGESYSPNYPKLSPVQSYLAGKSDIVVTEFSPNGTLIWSTFLGGSDRDWGFSVAVNTDGSVVLGCKTESTNMPTINAWQPVYGGGRLDAYLAKISPNYTLQWASYYGGSGDELDVSAVPVPWQRISIAIHPNGNIYFCGGTKSVNLPLVSPIQSSNHGGTDGFLGIITQSGQLVRSTYIGGSGDDILNSISIHNDIIVVAGGSTSINYPMYNPTQSYNSGAADGIAAMFDLSLSTLWSTYYGGTGDDFVIGALSVNSNEILLSGSSRSANLPLISPYQQNYNGDRDVFVVTYQYRDEMAVTVPNGGEMWTVGQTEQIRWTSSGVSAVQLEYSTNGGTNWQSIVSSVPAVSGSYTWTVPNTPSTQCRVRISDAANAGRFDISDAVFQIIQATALQLSVPNGGEMWTVGQTEQIRWTSAGVSAVQLEYSTNGGTNWQSIVSSVPAASGSYTWTVPNTPSTQCMVRISNAENTGLFDVSDDVFQIIQATAVQLSVPNGGETWTVGQTEQIRWTSSNVDSISIEYSTNNGSVWLEISSSVAAGAGIYVWAIPGTPSSECLVRVKSLRNASITDGSDSIFTIKASKRIVVLTPNGGEVWGVGSQKQITWTSLGVSAEKLEYSLNYGVDWAFISSRTSSIGRYDWEVPNTLTRQCKVKISDADDPSIYDVNDDVFYIEATSGLASLTQPFHIDVLPNPAANQISVVIESAYAGQLSLDLYNMLGQSVYSKDVQLSVGRQAVVIELSLLPSGNYFLHSVTEKNHRIQRIIKY